MLSGVVSPGISRKPSQKSQARQLCRKSGESNSAISLVFERLAMVESKMQKLLAINLITDALMTLNQIQFSDLA